MFLYLDNSTFTSFLDSDSAWMKYPSAFPIFKEA
jgi:hypothetical protein